MSENKRCPECGTRDCCAIELRADLAAEHSALLAEVQRLSEERDGAVNLFQRTHGVHVSWVAEGEKAHRYKAERDLARTAIRALLDEVNKTEALKRTKPEAGRPWLETLLSSASSNALNRIRYILRPALGPEPQAGDSFAEAFKKAGPAAVKFEDAHGEAPPTGRPGR